MVRKTEASLTSESPMLVDDATESSLGPTGDTTRSTLLCITTAYALLESQDVAKSASALGLDLTFFTSVLYRSLYSLALNPNVEASKWKLSFAESHSTPPSIEAQSTHNASKIKVHTTTVLLVRALSLILGPRSTPPLRLAAFTKQLYTSSLHLPEESNVALLSLQNSFAKAHGQKIAALWNTEERRGDGVFDPTRAEIEGSNPFATTIWEGELLRYHFSPKVRESGTTIEQTVRNMT